MVAGGGWLWLEPAEMKPWAAAHRIALACPLHVRVLSLQQPSLDPPSCTPILHGPGVCPRHCRHGHG